MRENWVEEVLSFWFGELSEEDWFTRKDATDAAVKSRFEPLYRELRAKVPKAAFEEPRAAQARWLLEQMRAARQLPADLDIAAAIATVYRPDLYRAAVADS